MTSDPPSVEQDSRGILDPWLLRQRITLNRYPVGPALTGVLDWFWAVNWDLPDGAQHRQQVVTHPGANFSVGHGDAGSAGFRPDRIEAHLNGVTTHITDRIMAGTGWTVAALTTPGGLGAFLEDSADQFTNLILPLDEVIAGAGAEMINRVIDAADEPARVRELAVILERAVRPERVETARSVAAIARIAETDRSVRSLGELAERAKLGPRTLQRLFREYAGVSPTWVLRRYRLLDAAEAVRDGDVVTWADIAADLGYADQAHLIREFRAATGQTPAAYAKAQGPR